MLILLSLLISLLFGLAVYAVGCFFVFKIINKFQSDVGFGQCLIPFWNSYLLLKVAVENPVAYFWYTILPAFILGFIGGFLDMEFLGNLGALISAVLWARAIGLIAAKLGKNFWLFAVLSFIPLANLIAIGILAFDNSTPVDIE